MTDKVRLIFYDANGNEVEEGSVEAVVQYRSDDPTRPKPKQKAQDEPAETKAVKSAPEDKSTPAPSRRGR